MSQRRRSPSRLRARLLPIGAALALAASLGANVAQAIPPDEGPGGPVLVIADPGNPFTRYYAVPLTEIGLQHDLDGTGQYLNFGVPNRLEVPLNGQ